MNDKLEIPKAIADHVNAINERNTDAFLDTFAADAVVTDEGHTYQGFAAISKWNGEKNIGAKITLDPVRFSESDGKAVLTAKVDGNFDKTGLPDPLMMNLHFTLDEGLIDSLSYSLAGA